MGSKVGEFSAPLFGPLFNTKNSSSLDQPTLVVSQRLLFLENRAEHEFVAFFVPLIHVISTPGRFQIAVPVLGTKDAGSRLQIIALDGASSNPGNDSCVPLALGLAARTGKFATARVSVRVAV
jgi:hypothetical protein